MELVEEEHTDTVMCTAPAEQSYVVCVRVRRVRLSRGAREDDQGRTGNPACFEERQKETPENRRGI